MSAKNLWGQLPSASEITTPTQILKEQASELTNMTKGVLYGDVHVKQRSGKFELEFVIQVPVLDNYEYVVLYVKHGLSLYPATVVPGWDQYAAEKQVACADKEQLETAIGAILSSDHVKRIVASLIAQSRAM